MHSFIEYRAAGVAQPILTEIVFRPHSLHCSSFTAMIRGGYNGRGVSFGQIVGLLANFGYVGNISDFTIKPIK